MKVVIVGSGNVAYHLVQVLVKTDAAIFIHARNKTQLDLLREAFPSIHILTSTDLVELEPSLVMLCVKDDVLEEVFSSYTYATSTLVAHTSGTQSIFSKGVHTHVGVCYPLQTFTKNQPVDWKRIPLLIESNTDKGIRTLEEFATYIEAPYFETNQAQRQAIHLTAVFTSNFTNHLIGKADAYLEANAIDYHILQPLIEETIRKAFSNKPFEVQTGPASRNDVQTIQKHLQLLQSDGVMKKIYVDITESIQKTSNLDSNKY